MQSVISVRFIESRGQLISLSKDKVSKLWACILQVSFLVWVRKWIDSNFFTFHQVLRIWDTHLQVCLQRLSGMFPKGPAEGRKVPFTALQLFCALVGNNLKTPMVILAVFVFIVLNKFYLPNTTQSWYKSLKDHTDDRLVQHQTAVQVGPEHTHVRS